MLTDTGHSCNVEFRLFARASISGVSLKGLGTSARSDARADNIQVRDRGKTKRAAVDLGLRVDCY